MKPKKDLWFYYLLANIVLALYNPEMFGRLAAGLLAGIVVAEYFPNWFE